MTSECNFASSASDEEKIRFADAIYNYVICEAKGGNPNDPARPGVYPVLIRMYKPGEEQAVTGSGCCIALQQFVFGDDANSEGKITTVTSGGLCGDC